MTGRIYNVKNTLTGAETLVRAGTQAQAVTRVVRNHYDAAVASQDDIVRLLSVGAKVLEVEPDPASQTGLVTQ